MRFINESDHIASCMIDRSHYFKHVKWKVLFNMHVKHHGNKCACQLTIWKGNVRSCLRAQFNQIQSYQSQSILILNLVLLMDTAAAVQSIIVTTQFDNQSALRTSLKFKICCVKDLWHNILHTMKDNGAIIFDGEIPIFLWFDILLYCSWHS